MTETIKDRNENYEEHSIFLSEIAMNILNGDRSFLNIPGVSEIIALYLLVPYATPSQLDQGMSSKMPKLDVFKEFTKNINLKDLRDTICHSFVSVEESTKERLGRIIIDDRALMNRNNHDKQETKTLMANLDIHSTNKKLIELHLEVINSISNR